MRCAKDCEDKVKDSIGTDASKVDMNKAQSAFEECLTKCADTNVAYIPTVRYFIVPFILLQLFTRSDQKASRRSDEETHVTLTRHHNESP